MSGLVDLIVAELRAGQPVVLPTDTIYGIAVDPTRPHAIDRLFDLKQRPKEVPIAVLVADRAQAESVAEGFGGIAGRLADQHWPGALTIVVRRQPSFDVDLGGPPDTVGVRLPAHDLVRAVAARVGPLATTSANVHGQPTPVEADAISSALQLDADRSVMIVDGGACSGLASTVVDCTGDAPQILRQGAVQIS